MFFNSLKHISFFIRKIKNPKLDLKQVITQVQKNQQSQLFTPLNLHKFKNPQEQKFIKEVQKTLAYQGQDKHPNQLVNRMQKGVVWGLGGQLLQFNKKLHKKGINANIQQIRQFLLQQQTKDVYVHDHGQQQKSKKRYSIIASAYSNRHCFKVGIELKKAFMLGKDKKDYDPLFVGRKEDEWVLLQFKDFNVHIMTENEREDSALEWKWNNPVSQQVIQKYKKMQRSKTRKHFQPLQ